MEARIIEAQQAIQRARRIVANALVVANAGAKHADVTRSLTGLNMALVGCEYYVQDILEYVQILEQGERAFHAAPEPPTDGPPNART